MSIAILNQVYDETRRLTVAGSNLAKDDFRLRKLVEPLSKAGEKVPVFGQVAKSIEKLVDAPEKESPQALLDLGSLVLAILYTLGETDAKGTIQSIPTTDMDVQTTQASARRVKPLIEALTTTGSGRHAIVTEAFERGEFQDLRLVNYAIAGLDDKYSEIADFIADKVLPIYGTAIIPRINDRIDIKGSGGSVRRLRLLYQLDPETARPIVMEAFENGNKDMRIAALGCLGDAKEDLPHLLEQAQAKSREVRAVAYQRLAKFTDNQAVEILGKALDNKDVNIATGPISQSKSNPLIEQALERTAGCLEQVGNASDKKLKSELERLAELLNCFTERSEKKVTNFLADFFQRRSELLPAKTTAKSLVDHVVAVLCSRMLSTTDTRLLKLLADEYENLDESAFAMSLIASRCVLKPAEVYNRFSRFYLEQNPKGKRAGKDRAEVISLELRTSGQRYRYWHHGHAELNRELLSEKLEKSNWDSRWLDAAIKKDDFEVVSNLAEPKHKSLLKYVEVKLKPDGKSMRHDYFIGQVIDLALRVHHPKATEMLIGALRTVAAKKNSYIYWLAPLVSKLPANAAGAVEELVSSLPDRAADEILSHLQTLKAKKN